MDFCLLLKTWVISTVKILDTAKKSTTDAIKTVSKTEIQKTAK